MTPGKSEKTVLIDDNKTESAVVKVIIAAFQVVCLEGAFVTVQVKFVVAENMESLNFELPVLFEQFPRHGHIMTEIPHVDEKFRTVFFRSLLDGGQSFRSVRLEPDGVMVQI